MLWICPTSLSYTTEENTTIILMLWVKVSQSGTKPWNRSSSKRIFFWKFVSLSCVHQILFLKLGELFWISSCCFKSFEKTLGSIVKVFFYGIPHPKSWIKLCKVGKTCFSCPSRGCCLTRPSQYDKLYITPWGRCTLHTTYELTWV